MRTITIAMMLLAGTVISWAGEGHSGDCHKGKTTAAAAASAEKAAAPAPAPLTAQAAFDDMKTLAGTWEGEAKTADAPKATVNYRVISNGSTIMESLFPGTPEE